MCMHIVGKHNHMVKASEENFQDQLPPGHFNVAMSLIRNDVKKIK